MKLHELPAGSRYLDVDGIAVVMLPAGPKGVTCIAFADGKGLDVESRPYPNVQKAGMEGDVLSRAAFERWLTTGQAQPLGT